MGSKGIIIFIGFVLIAAAILFYGSYSTFERMKPALPTPVTISPQQALATQMVSEAKAKAEVSKTEFFTIIWKVFLAGLVFMFWSAISLGTYGIFKKIQGDAIRKRFVETVNGKHYLITERAIIDPSRQVGPGTRIDKLGNAFPTGIDHSVFPTYVEATRADQEGYAPRKIESRPIHAQSFGSSEMNILPLSGNISEILEEALEERILNGD